MSTRSAAPATSEHLRFLHTVASLYHLEGQTQAEIAEALGVSRTKVLRALQEARAVGIVQISVVDPSGTDEALAHELVAAFGLESAVVVAGHPDDAVFTRRRVGAAAARYLDDTLPDDATLGLGWGRTLFEVTQALQSERRRTLRVVPLMGGLGQVAASFQVHDMARAVCERLGGSWTPFFLPGIVDDGETHAALLGSADAASVRDAWSALDVALFGIGDVDLSRELQMLFAAYLNDDVRDRMRRSGVVGDVCMRFLRADGSGVDDALEHVLAIELDALRRAPRKVAVACGAEKATAILAALRGDLVDVLVTDVAAARALLRAGGGRPKEARP
ncbi:MAG: sugar-binding domain-containing protein [Trueperaceae bacterium]|nr:sugar-binding domain-containing protein [Trueperaceae bacterium]